MKRSIFKRFGPFSYFCVKEGRRHFISAWLKRYENAPFGWEYGTDDTDNQPSFCLRLWHFDIFRFERYKVGGFIVTVFGFWYSK